MYAIHRIAAVETGDNEMSSPKDILRYTERWLDLFDKFQDDPKKEHVVRCANPKQANMLRLEFYKAREALRKSEEALKASDPTAYSVMGHPNLDRKEVRVQGNNVIFGFKDASQIAKLLEESLKDPINNASE